MTQEILFRMCPGETEEMQAPDKDLNWCKDVLSLIDHIEGTLDRRGEVVTDRKRKARTPLLSPRQLTLNTMMEDAHLELPPHDDRLLDATRNPSSTAEAGALPETPTVSPTASRKLAKTRLGEDVGSIRQSPISSSSSFRARSRDDVGSLGIEASGQAPPPRFPAPSGHQQPFRASTAGTSRSTTTSVVPSGQQAVLETDHPEAMPRQSRSASLAGGLPPAMSTRSSSRRSSAAPAASASGTEQPENSTPPPDHPLPVMKGKPVHSLTEVLDACHFLGGDGKSRLDGAALCPTVLEILKPHLDPFRDEEGWTELNRLVRGAGFHCIRNKLHTKGRYGTGEGMTENCFEPCKFCKGHGVPCMRRHSSSKNNRVLVIPTTLRKGKQTFDLTDPTVWVNVQSG